MSLGSTKTKYLQEGNHIQLNGNEPDCTKVPNVGGLLATYV